VAWVPPPWLDAAERTLAGMAERHPSRTVLLVPRPEERESRIDADLSVRCFPAGDRSICGEVIELHLLGRRALAPASIVLPLAISDLPVFVRWRGEPAFGETQWEQLVGLADRVVVDSSEWDELRYRELSAAFERTAVSDIAWARIYEWRGELSVRLGHEELAAPRAEPRSPSDLLSAELDRFTRDRTYEAAALAAVS
jgi:glucose-6-phosphate dehydrogenase assembly protein OpcA